MGIFASYLVLGALAGLTSGLLGLGGGIVLVPALYYLFELQSFAPEIGMHLAVGTSLSTIVFTSMVSAYSHHRRGAVNWDVVAFLAPGIAVGALLGTAVADRIDSTSLRILFGLFELFVAIQLGLVLKPAAHRQLPSTPNMGIVGAGIGALSSVLGIGGGTLTVPFLVWSNVAIPQAIATSAACGFPIAVAGTLGFMATGWDNGLVPSKTLGYIYWPATLSIILSSSLFAPIGAAFAHRLPVATLKRLFALLLALFGFRMLSV